MKPIVRNIALIIGIIVFLVFIHIYIYNNLDSKVDDIRGRAEMFINYINSGKYNEAKEEVHAMRGIWEKYSGNMALYIDHNDIENIGVYITVMEGYLKNEAYFDAVAEAKRIISKVRDILGREELTIENIF